MTACIATAPLIYIFPMLVYMYNAQQSHGFFFEKSGRVARRGKVKGARQTRLFVAAARRRVTARRVQPLHRRLDRRLRTRASTDPPSRAWRPIKPKSTNTSKSAPRSCSACAVIQRTLAAQDSLLGTVLGRRIRVPACHTAQATPQAHSEAVLLPGRLGCATIALRERMERDRHYPELGLGSLRGPRSVLSPSPPGIF
jgi:hypothetical protein